MFKILNISIFSIILSGCNILGPIKVEKNIEYSLELKPTIKSNRTDGSSLLVTTPSLNNVFKGQRVKFTNQKYSYQNIKGIKWSTSIESMVEMSIVRAFEHSNFFTAVVTSNVANNIKWKISSRINYIYKYIDQSTGVNKSMLSITFTLYDIINNNVVNSKVFTESKDLESDSEYNYIEVTNLLLEKVINEGVKFTLQNIR